MRKIDSRYERGDLADIDDLEMLLEATLDRIESVLCEVDEDADPGEDLEPDVDAEPDPGEGCSIEEQFVEAYERHLRYPHAFPHDSLVECLRDVLFSAQRGGMTPSGFRGAGGEALVNLAAELQRDYRTRADIRSRSPLRAASSPRSYLDLDCPPTNELYGIPGTYLSHRGGGVPRSP